MEINVLLADDHAIVRDGLSALLKSHLSIRVVGTATDGYDAIRQVRELRPDIVLMDISMPMMNGIQATIKITENCPETKVIILSMYDSPEHIYRAMKAGARGYLLKESAGHEVIKAIRLVQRGGNYLSRKVTEKMTDQFDTYRTRGTKRPLDNLSAREMETFQLVVEGKSSIEISKELNLSKKTIETYRSRIMHKLGIHDVPSLVKYAIQQGVTSLEE